MFICRHECEGVHMYVCLLLLRLQAPATAPYACSCPYVMCVWMYVCMYVCMSACPYVRRLARIDPSKPLCVYVGSCMYVGLSGPLCASLCLSEAIWASLGLSGSTSEASTYLGLAARYHGISPRYLLGLFRLQGTTAYFHCTSWDFLGLFYPCSASLGVST